jgi:hypothetical protein
MLGFLARNCMAGLYAHRVSTTTSHASEGEYRYFGKRLFQVRLLLQRSIQLSLLLHKVSVDFL